MFNPTDVHHDRANAVKCIKELCTFVSGPSSTFVNAKNDVYTNIVCPGLGSFEIPFGVRTDKTVLPSLMDKFMDLLEKCRLEKQVTHYTEKQYFKVRTPEDKSAVHSNPQYKYTSSSVTKSGIFIDLDIISKHSHRKYKPENLHALATSIFNIICSIVDISSEDNIYMAVLTRSSVDRITDPAKATKYGECYKEGFHILIPSIKVEKRVKIYIVNQLQQDPDIVTWLSDYTGALNVEDVFDKGACSAPSAFYGCSKPSSTSTYKISAMYVCRKKSTGNIISLTTEFDPKIEKKKVKGKKDKIKIEKYDYNMCYELSLNYENPYGKIVKKEYEPLLDKMTLISNEERKEVDSMGKRYLSDEFLEDLNSRVTGLSILNPTADKIKKFLDILSEERVMKYDNWRKVIFALAITNRREFFPLAQYFSTRCPEAYSKGPKHLEELWNVSSGTENPVSIGTVYAWAREDNLVAYNKIMAESVGRYIFKTISQKGGDLGHYTLAGILYEMLQDKFVYDAPQSKKGGSGIWYEFVTDNDKHMVGQVWRWRAETDIPDTMSHYISTTMYAQIKEVMDHYKAEAEKAKDEEQISYSKNIIKKVSKVLSSLQNHSSKINIIKEAMPFFRCRGFIKNLDMTPNYLGVINGILQLQPKIELITRKHDIPISQSCQAEYVPYDPTDEYVIRLENILETIFAKDKDAYRFTMMYLAATLDGRPKTSLFYIWLGEGANGKSLILEFHVNMLGPNHYAFKIPIKKFTEDRKKADEADSVLIRLKYARLGYTSESKEGAELESGLVKELTGGEILSLRPLYGENEQIEHSCAFVCATNHNPRISCSDHGIWRRVKVYNFKMKFVYGADPKNPMEKERNDDYILKYTKDRKFRNAYLAIMLKWYTILQKEYGGDLLKVLNESPTIIRESEDYRNSQDTINRFITTKLENKVGVPPIELSALVSKYMLWYKSTINSEAKLVASDLQMIFRKSCLKPNIVQEIDGYYVQNYIIRDIDNPRATPIKNLEQGKPIDKGDPYDLLHDVKTSDGPILKTTNPPEEIVDDIILEKDTIADDIVTRSEDNIIDNIIPDKETDDILPDKETDDIIPDKETDDIIPDKETDDILPDEEEDIIDDITL